MQTVLKIFILLLFWRTGLCFWFNPPVSIPRQCQSCATGEFNCLCNGNERYPYIGIFECKPRSALCDGIRHCNNGKDETDCWCRNKTFRCHNCHFDLSCESLQSSDFPICSYLPDVDKDFTGCWNDSMILKEICPACIECNNYQEFDQTKPGNNIQISDEKGCGECPDDLPNSCGCNTQDNFNCRLAGYTCYNDSMKCDKVPQCSDSFDEVGCQCSQDEFRCKCYENDLVSSVCQGTPPCIKKSKLGNCIRDCADDSDEISNERVFPCPGCQSSVSVRRDDTCSLSSYCSSYQCYSTSAPLCSSQEQHICTSGCSLGSPNCRHGFQCQNGELALRYHFCDGITECSDGSDEIKDDTGFKCSGRNGWCVLPQRNLFDILPQCHDNADVCIYTKENCFFKCLFSNIFISNRQVCDGVFDCPDLSDECLCDKTRNHLRCLETFLSEPACNLDSSQTDSYSEIYEDKDNLENQLESSFIKFDSFVWAVGILTVVLNLTALAPLFGFYKSKIYIFDRFQIFFILNICLAYVCLAVFLLVVGRQSSNTIPWSHTISCSQAGALAMTGAEVLTLLFFLLALFRFYYPKYMEDLEKKVASKMFRQLALAFLIIWFLAFLIAFMPVAASSDFFSKTVWFNAPFTSRKIWSKPAAIEYACRWAKLTKKEPIYDLESAMKFSLQTGRFPNLKGEFASFKTISVCFVNFLVPFDQGYSNYMISVNVLNSIIYIITFVLIAFVRIKERMNEELDDEEDEEDECNNEENNCAVANDDGDTTIDDDDHPHHKEPLSSDNDQSNESEDHPVKVIPSFPSVKTGPNLEICDEVDTKETNHSSKVVDKRQGKGYQQSIKHKQLKTISSIRKKQWKQSIKNKTLKRKQNFIAPGNNAPTGDIESSNSIESKDETQPQEHMEETAKNVEPSTNDPEGGKSFLTGQDQSKIVDDVSANCSDLSHESDKQAVVNGDQSSSGEKKSTKGDDQSEKASIAPSEDIITSKIPQSYLDYIIMANSLCWLAFTIFICLRFAGAVSLSADFILTLAFLFFVNGVITPLLLWYINLHLFMHICCINTAPDTEEEYMQRQLWLQEMNFITI